MNTLHTKSPCCRSKTRRFGKRRRQCITCHRTWRIRTKKRGRKAKRESVDLVKRYLNQLTPSLKRLASVRHESYHHLKNRLDRSLKNFLNHTSWPALPQEGQLIAIADAMVRCLAGKWYTYYFILIRGVTDKKALVTPPYLRNGTEVYQGWQETFSRLPQDVRNRIIAMVCDGHRGLVWNVRDYGWHLQRCHFHLIARIQGRRSRWKQSRHRREGKLLYQHTYRIIKTTDKEVIRRSLSVLRKLTSKTTSPHLKSYLKGFLNNYENYQTYLRHPELYLPTTSNAVESLISSVKEMCHRARGFSSTHSLSNWVEALLKHKKSVVCNGNYQPNYDA